MLLYFLVIYQLNNQWTISLLRDWISCGSNAWSGTGRKSGEEACDLQSVKILNRRKSRSPEKHYIRNCHPWPHCIYILYPEKQGRKKTILSTVISPPGRLSLSSFLLSHGPWPSIVFFFERKWFSSCHPKTTTTTKKNILDKFLVDCTDNTTGDYKGNWK